MRNYIQHVKEKLLESIQSLASQKRYLFYIEIRILVVIESSHLKPCFIFSWCFSVSVARLTK